MTQPLATAQEQDLQKFLFNRSFDGMSTDSFDKPKEPSFTQAQLDAARAEGWQAGHEAGLQAALDSQQHRLTGLIAQVEQKITELLAASDTQRDQALQHATDIATAIMRRLLPSYAEREGLTEIRAILAQALREMNREPRLVVRVSEDNFDAVSAEIKDLEQRHAYNGKVVVLAEAGMGPADCLIEWADGGLERDMKSLWQDIDRVLATAHGHSAPPSPHSPSGE
jgi:flagellar assembly protein FliH